MALAEVSVETAGLQKQVSSSIRKHGDLYPPLDIGKETRGENREESVLIEQGDLKKLDELKQLSKKMSKDLKELNKRRKEMEQKLKQKESPPKCCFFFNFKTGAIIVGGISLVLFSLCLAIPFSKITDDDYCYKHGSDNNNNNVNTESAVQLLLILTTFTPLPLLGIVAANLLLFGIFMNRRGFLLSYLILNALLLNLYLVLSLVTVDIAQISSFFAIIASVFEAFALYIVYNFYKIMD